MKPIVSLGDANPSLSLFLTAAADADGHAKGHGGAWKVTVPIRPLVLDGRSEAENALGAIYRVRTQRTPGVSVFLDCNANLQNPSEARLNAENELSLVVVLDPFIPPFDDLKIEVLGFQPTVEFTGLPAAPAPPQHSGPFDVSDLQGGEVLSRAERVSFMSPILQKVVATPVNLSFADKGFYEVTVSLGSQGQFRNKAFFPSLTFGDSTKARAWELPASRTENSAKFMVKIEQSGTYSTIFKSEGDLWTGNAFAGLTATFSEPLKLQ